MVYLPQTLELPCWAALNIPSNVRLFVAVAARYRLPGNPGLIMWAYDMDNVPLFSIHTHDTPGLNIAVFIDADNAPKGRLGDVFRELGKHGVVSIRRAFGNWKKLDSWVSVLHQHAIQPVQVFDLIKGKNASDIAMVCDVMDVLYNKSVDVFCLVSSDCDFTPLVMKLRAEGKQVLGVGEHKAPAPFVDACTDFIYLDDPEAAQDLAVIENLEKVVSTPPAPTTTATASAKPMRRRTGDEMKSDSTLVNWLREAIKATSSVDGWAGLSTVGAWLQKEKSMAPRNYGYAKLVDIFHAIDLFDVQRNNDTLRVAERKRLSKPPSLARS